MYVFTSCNDNMFRNLCRDFGVEAFWWEAGGLCAISMWKDVDAQVAGFGCRGCLYFPTVFCDIRLAD